MSYGCWLGWSENASTTRCKLLKGVGTGKVLRECTDYVADEAEFLEDQIG